MRISYRIAGEDALQACLEGALNEERDMTAEIGNDDRQEDRRLSPGKGRKPSRQQGGGQRSQSGILEGLIHRAPLLICSMEASGAVTFLNAAAEEIMKCRTGDVMGRNWWTLAYPGDETQQVEALFKHLEKGEVTGYEMTLTGLDGDRRTVQWNSMTRFDENGRMMGITGYGIDVTPTRGAEQRLRALEMRNRQLLETFLREAERKRRESEARYRDLFESTIDAVMILRGNRFIEANQATLRMFGFESLNRFLGMHPFELAPSRQPDGRASEEAAAEHLQRALNLGYDKFEWTHCRTDGTEFPSEVWLSALKNSHPRLIQATVRDISARKRAEAERIALQEQILREQKSQALGILARGIAHDFNNILGGIMGYTELALTVLPKDCAARSDLNLAIKAADRGRELVDQVLSYGRPQSTLPVPLELGQLVKETLDLVKGSLQGRIRLETELGDKPVWIRGVRTQIHQVLMNLCTNAVQAMAAEGGVLHLSIERLKRSPLERDPEGGPDGPWAELRVRDTGPGMSAEVARKIFKPYYTTKAAAGGTGLGLQVTQTIVKEHGGEIRVSTEEGHGTLFRVRIPCLPRSHAANTDPTAP